MSARDVIYDRLTHLPGPHKFRDLSILGIATEAEEALTAAGYRILGPDDFHTIKRALTLIERNGIECVPDIEAQDAIRAAIRALSSGGKQ